MKNKNLLLIIDNFERGGAETMLVNLLPLLNKNYNVILVTLNNISHFQKDDIDCLSRHILNFYSYKDMANAVISLKRIIKETKPDLVHAQLYWSTIVARLATPKHIPFLFSIHNKLSIDAFKANRLSLYLERLTYTQRQTILSVSNDALNDYKDHINVKGRTIILNNFVHENFFKQQYEYSERALNKIKIVSVGNLRYQKNYNFLLDTINLIKDEVDIELDIVGEGKLRDELQAKIDKNHLPIRLAGKLSNVEKVLPKYDGFLMCSHYEGFGNAPVEAMAVGLPLILNDLAIMKEMSKGNALFYENENQTSLANLLLNFSKNKNELIKLSEQGKKVARENYSISDYFSKLSDIYISLIKENLSKLKDNH